MDFRCVAADDCRRRHHRHGHPGRQWACRVGGVAVVGSVVSCIQVAAQNRLTTIFLPGLLGCQKCNIALPTLFAVRTGNFLTAQLGCWSCAAEASNRMNFFALVTVAIGDYRVDAQRGGNGLVARNSAPRGRRLVAGDVRLVFGTMVQNLRCGRGRHRNIGTAYCVFVLKYLVVVVEFRRGKGGDVSHTFGAIVQYHIGSQGCRLETDVSTWFQRLRMRVLVGTAGGRRVVSPSGQNF